MDMQIDPCLIRTERKKRAWSQEHLAEATGLGLRTIQRIEATGIASNESASALAAVLSVPLDRLTSVERGETRPIREARSRPSFVGLGAAVVAGPCTRTDRTRTAVVAAVLAVSVYRFALADDIAMDVGVSLYADGEDEPSQVAMSKLLVEDGAATNLEVDGIARFVITPNVRDDGRVFISVEVFEFDGSDYVKTREPRVLTENGREAEIVFGSSSGNVVRVTLTPGESAEEAG